MISVQAEGKIMIQTYKAKYTKIRSGYMGHIVKWPEVRTMLSHHVPCELWLKDKFLK